MHERALLNDLIREIEETAASEHATGSSRSASASARCRT